ncbi:MAG: AmmeMemoRadiSam system protein A [Myxococcota bacterium]|nr:AmmeMemoRadiSam system protein A [Myxococcota bacterium]
MAGTEPLDIATRDALLDIARQAILSHVQRGGLPEFELPQGPLHDEVGAFVSLHLDGELRGCIGRLEGEGPLYQTVAQMAVAAATEDARFEPLPAADLRHTEIEVSVLGPLRPIKADSIEVGTHGLYVVQGRFRSVLLPQVPVQFGWSREEFLVQGCRKAGLGDDAWKDTDTMLLSFTAQVFGDADAFEEEGD